MHRQRGGTKNLLVLITIHSTANLHREKSELGCRGRERGASRGEDRQRAMGANGAAGPSERGEKPFLPALPLTLELRGCSWCVNTIRKSPPLEIFSVLFKTKLPSPQNGAHEGVLNQQALLLPQAAYLGAILVIAMRPQPDSPRWHDILICQFGISGPIIHWIICGLM